jgi:hypothetical protein
MLVIMEMEIIGDINKIWEEQDTNNLITINRYIKIRINILIIITSSNNNTNIQIIY